MGPDFSHRAAAELRAVDRGPGPLARLRARRGRLRALRGVARPPSSARREPAGASAPGLALFVMPPRAPLAAPIQSLHAPPTAIRHEVRASPGSLRNRLVLVAGALTFGLLYGAVLTGVLSADGRLDPLEALTAALSAVLGAWLAFGFIGAAAGFVTALAEPQRRPGPARPSPRGRTAILLPAYNEDPGLILAAVEAMAEDLRAAGLAELCDLFVLSDTREPAIAGAEARGVLRLRARLAHGPQVYYRRRQRNTDRKAGNIVDWVEGWGGAYDYMLVLDADSLMSSEAVAELITRMDAEPGLGLLQTVPTILHAVTPFARIQQFANRLYGPVFARGQAWWSGSEGNYWGHNAIIRTAAFAASARLPHLSGPRPFGGHIQSHDFVEAALLRRAGWAVRIAPDIAGSHEESPPTLLDAAARDRRWCQGNLQHARVLAAAGLHWVSRLHLVCGIMAYLAPALWLALLVVGGLVWPGEHLGASAAPRQAMIGLFAASLALLAAPKLMALSLALGDPALRRGFGGAAMLAGGVALESAASLLTTPVVMVMQAVAVGDVLLGRDSGWSAQHREGVALSRADAWQAHWGHVLLGLAGAAGAAFVGRDFLLWTSPVFLSLTLSALLSLHSSRPLPEPAAGEMRLLRIPEETTPPRVALRAMALRRAHAAGVAGRPEEVYDPTFAGALALVA